MPADEHEIAGLGPDRIPDVPSGAETTSTPRRQRIVTERHWRGCPDSAHTSSAIMLSRWRCSQLTAPLRVKAVDTDERHIVSLVIRTTQADLRHGARLMHRGILQPGTLAFSGPRSSTVRGTFYAGFDHFRLYLPQSVIAECHEMTHGRLPNSPIQLLEAAYSRHPHMVALMSSLLQAGDDPEPCLVEGISLALTYTLMMQYAHHVPYPERTYRSVCTGVKRAIDYIEAYLDQKISLSQLASLSGMHRAQFAMAFKAAMGLPPHQYIVHRRLHRAKQLLAARTMSITEVALHSGFCSQAHMTATFRRLLGQTPGQWCQHRGMTLIPRPQN